MIRSDVRDLSPVAALGPVSLTADNTPSAIDLLGFESATILIGVGAGGITFDTDNKIEFKITASDDDSTYTAVAAADVILSTGCDASVGTGGIVKSLIAAHASADVSKLAYIGGKRYLKILADFTGTHGTGTPLSVLVLKGRAHHRPV